MNSSIVKNLKLRIAFKFLLAAIVLFFLAATLLLIIENGVDNIRDEDPATYIRWCDRDYYDRDWAKLADTLTLFELYGDEYAMYWEAVKGYSDLVQYEQWRAAQEQSLPHAESMAAQFAERLRENAENAAFPQNKEILNGFASAAESIE